jgi:hypothetical protein
VSGDTLLLLLLIQVILALHTHTASILPCHPSPSPGAKRTTDLHDKINTTKLLNTLLDSILETLHTPNIHLANSKHLRAFPCSRNFGGYRAGLLGIPPDYACVGAEVN